MKPPGYQFKLGAKERDGEFVVHLTLTGESVNQKFIGEGNQPYEAKREAAIKAKAYLSKAEKDDSKSELLQKESDDRNTTFSKQITESEEKIKHYRLNYSRRTK